MKTKTLKLICIATLGGFITLPLWGRGIFSATPPSDPKGKPCSQLAGNTELDVTIITLQLNYDPAKYPFSKDQFWWYHNQTSSLNFVDLINFRTEELPADQRSFIKVILQGATCTGTVESRIDQAAQVSHNIIRGVKYFHGSPGDFKDTRIIANSIVSGAGQRLVWTKTYSHANLCVTFQNWTADPDGQKHIVKASGVVQYPQEDSMYLYDDSWMTAPVYNDGDFTTGGSSGGNGEGGGTVIDPEPYDSLEFIH